MIYKFMNFKEYLDALLVDKTLFQFYATASEEAERVGMTRAAIGNQILRKQRSAVRIGRRLTLVNPKES